MKVNIAVLNYNGISLLRECMPSVLEACKASSNICTVTVVDNGSTDKSLDFLRENFPDVVIYIAKTNSFLCSFNDFAEFVSDDIIILLNSDIKLTKGFVDPLVEVFNGHKDAFMSGPQCWTFDKRQYEGTRTKIRMKFGFFQAFSRYPGYEKDIEVPGYTASAGSVAAFRRDRFLELGGYDNLYLPGRVEDVDLCYRGWKRGYKAYYVPQSVSYHKGLASFKRAFGYQNTLVLSYRNTFLFIWKNITDVQLLFEHVIFLMPWLLFSLAKFNFSFLRGFTRALVKLPKALSRRGNQAAYFKEKDKHLLNLLGWKKSPLLS